MISAVAEAVVVSGLEHAWPQRSADRHHGGLGRAEMAPNRVPDTAAVTARPPRRWPKKVIARSSRRLAVRPRVTISAARMNIGTVISATG